MHKGIWLVILLIGVLALAFSEDRLLGEAPASQRRPPAPSQPPPPTGPPLPGGTPADPILVIESDPPTDRTGTGFAIGPGLWMTASHVVEGCAALGVMTSAREGLRAALVAAHPVADVSIIRTEGSGPALALALTAGDLKVGQGAFHFGFPEGSPGDAASRLIGRMKARTLGRRGLAPLLAWAESSRVPATPSLGGMSGGPTVDGAGRVVGVTVAESMRRGRIFTAAPASMAGAVRLSGTSPAGTPSAGVRRETLTQTGYPAHGDRLREQLTVAQIVCLI